MSVVFYDPYVSKVPTHYIIINSVAVAYLFCLKIELRGEICRAGAQSSFEQTYQ